MSGFIYAAHFKMQLQNASHMQNDQNESTNKVKGQNNIKHSTVTEQTTKQQKTEPRVEIYEKLFR